MTNLGALQPEIDRLRRENVRDGEQRLVILGDGLGGALENLYADLPKTENDPPSQKVWVRDLEGSVAYRVLGATNGTTIEINKRVYIEFKGGPKEWQVVMSDPDFMTATGRSIHLENSSDPHNQFKST